MSFRVVVNTLKKAAMLW